MGLLDKAKKVKETDKSPEEKAIEEEEKEWENEVGKQTEPDGKIDDRQEP